MTDVHDIFRISELYSNEEIYKSLCVGNAGGVRIRKGPSGDVERLVIFTSQPTARQLAENPYHDRREGDILIYTGAGKEGDQTLGGVNARIVQQQDTPFPIYGFAQIASRRDPTIGNKRWVFLGLMQYLRSFRERQVDARGVGRDAWVFEFFVHSDPVAINKNLDANIIRDLIESHSHVDLSDDRDVVIPTSSCQPSYDQVQIEQIRRRLLAFEPRQFEHVVHDLLGQSGFEQIEVTKYSQDGGIDLNARPGLRSWPIRHLLVQLQAKRWHHTVGRKEVAELRGSLQPHAAGCILTTSHFSRAAITESTAAGKVPILAIDGYELANVVATFDLRLP